MSTKLLENYAEVAIRIGVNLQKGQRLVVQAPVEAASFVRLLAERAYAHGARDVMVDWSDDELTRLRYQWASDEALQDYPKWKAQGFTDLAKEGAAFLTVAAPNPDLLRGIGADKVAAASKAAALALAEYARMRQNGDFNWCILAVPTTGWATSVFPGLDAEQAIDRLWDYIFKATRSDLPDPISAWKRHIGALTDVLSRLNQKQYRKLYYKAKGTDLVVELPEGHQWVGGGMRNPLGVFFTPNLPTEEVFTAPAKYGVHGVVRSTRPLNYRGHRIEDFVLTFKDGAIVDAKAARGYETLQQLLETDAGSRYLGEVALVPEDSPIAKLNVTFNNTLYDENASCHLAIGSAYPICISGGATMSKEELEKHQLNTSLVHVDFMMGAPDLDIDGETADGVREPIFRRGNWA